VLDSDEKLRLLDLVVEALVSGREAALIKMLLKSELSKTFIYLKRALIPIYARIEAFDQASVGSKETIESEVN
jgi:hypothetical protein